VSGDDLARETPARRTVYRWDLDKTYLSTDFDSLKGLWRAAREKAEDKLTFPGARSLLRELCATEHRGLYILSGSPEQMRKVLEEKLRLDGITWNSLVLKPSLNRLLRGRFRFLRDQVSYKLSALLSSRVSIGAAYDEVMFGDDAEADAFVYSLYCDLCAGRVGLDLLARVLELARAYDDDAAELLELARTVPRKDPGRRIFIHLERIEPSAVFHVFGPRVCAFHNYFQPAVVLLEDRLIDADAALRVGLELTRLLVFSPEALSASYVDLAQRGLLGAETGALLLAAVERAEARHPDAAEMLAGLRRSVAACPLPAQGLSPSVAVPLDYGALLPTDRARAHRAKSRARPPALRGICPAGHKADHLAGSSLC
jgi:hypothetical protein